MQFKRVKNQQQKYERLADLEMGKLNGGSSDNLVTKGKKDTREELGKKPHLSLYELFIVLMPYFWPSSGSDGAFVNRLRSTSTWFMVALSKVCNLVAPFYLSTATNSMTESHFKDATKAIVMYCFLRVASSTCKELQGILYIRVKQQASIELQELTFSHVHSLSLNWHLSKKTGGVIKSMDRGVSAANQLITYLFLFLVPAVLECLSVIVLFFVQYKQWSLGKGTTEPMTFGTTLGNCCIHNITTAIYFFLRY